MSDSLEPTGPPGSSVREILQARILEWVVISFFPSPGDLPDPGIESRSPALQADSLPAGFVCLCVLYQIENTIRWRIRRNKDGIKIKESNARIVKWSDGR